MNIKITNNLLKNKYYFSLVNIYCFIVNKYFGL